jgi:hypothetical protein
MKQGKKRGKELATNRDKWEPLAGGCCARQFHHDRHLQEIEIAVVPGGGESAWVGGSLRLFSCVEGGREQGQSYSVQPGSNDTDAF